jgi:hypothetical protein
MNSSSKGAFLSGLVYPGLGQIVQKNYLKGAALIIVFTASLVVTVISASKQFEAMLNNIEASNRGYDVTTILLESAKSSADEDTGAMKIASALLLSCWVIGTVDAYLSGKKIDSRDGQCHSLRKPDIR